MKPAKLLSMSDAADALGEEHRKNVAQWMRRRLRRREAEMGMKILYLDGREWKVPIHKLRLAFPHKLEPDKTAARGISKKLSKLVALVAAIDDRVDSIEANQGALSEAFRGLSKAHGTRCTTCRKSA